MAMYRKVYMDQNQFGCVVNVFIDLIWFFLSDEMSCTFNHHNFLQQRHVFLKSTAIDVLLHTWNTKHQIQIPDNKFHRDSLTHLKFADIVIGSVCGTEIFDNFPIRAPSNQSAPVMPNNKHLICTNGVDECDEVADDVKCSKLGRIVDGCAGSVSVATEVRGDCTVPVGGEVDDLMAPRVPELRETVD
ncbi:hypothetical protein LXL04_025991 [Taraxacum kok-saghyz]